MRLTRFPQLAALVGAATLAATASPADDKKADDGWVQLFDGKDLTGWKIYPDPNKGAIKKVLPREDAGKLLAIDAETTDGKTVHLWRVENGTLIGSGPSSHLFTDGGDYDNFHFRVEAKINDGGNSGQYFRTKFGPGFPAGYEAQINATHRDPIRTGSLYPDGRTKLGQFRKEICVMNDAPNKPDEFFTQEVVADGNHIQIFVNGKKTIDFTDPNSTYMKGHFALQGHDPGTVVTFRKIEYKPIKK